MNRQTTLRICSLLMFSVLAAVPLQAQSDLLRQRFGLYGDLNMNMHSAELQGLPGVPSCSPMYESGFGLAPAFGLMYEYPVAGDLLLSLRAGFNAHSATLASDEQQMVEIDGNAVPITIEHRIDASLGSIMMTPMIGWRAGKSLTLMAGGDVGFVLTKGFAQEERLSEDDRRGVFENGRRVRNESSGDLPDASSLAAALILGASYEIPLNDQGTFLAAPEILFSYGLTPVISGISWNTHALRGGVALKYSPLPNVEVQPPPPVQKKLPVLAATISASGIESSGNEEAVARIRVEEFIATDMRPLLSYVFFDENSGAIPDRYTTRSATQSAAFSVDSLYGSGTIEVYHDMLNVVGLRMREHPTATLRLVGTNAGTGNESGNRALSRQRAESVRDYLRDTWGIAEKRLKVEAVDLPAAPSNPAHAEGIEENRRVEIYANDPAILSPVRTADTMRETTPPAIRFRTAVESEAGVASWHLTAMQDGQLLKEFTGSGAVPEIVDWKVEAEQGTVPRAPGVVLYQLNLVDNSGQQHQTAAGKLPVEQVTVRKKRNERIADVNIERYNLILFDYDRAELGTENRRLVEEIRERITPESHVKITGYTDRIGDAAYNERLAMDRARAVAASLKLNESQVEVRGETVPQYDQTLPEGRFNSRSVVIEIETPIKEGDSG